MMQQPTSKPRQKDDLSGTRILVADDEIFIALDIAETLADAGAEIFGPCTTLSEAVDVARNCDVMAATLDIRLGSVTTEAIAVILADRGIPFIFYSGQTLPVSMRERWPDALVFKKPAPVGTLVTALASLLN